MVEHDEDTPLFSATNDTINNMEDMDAMTPEELRDALRAARVALLTERTRADELEQALMTERARYAFLVNNHPLMQERIWLTRAFRTCTVQHAFTCAML